MYCINCGAEIKKGDTFCNQCGVAVNPDKSDKKAKSEKIFKVFVIAFTAISLVSLVAVVAVSNSYKDYMKSFFGEIPDAREIKNEEKAVKNASTDWQEMKIVLDGVEYQLPFRASELIENGWDFGVEDDEEIIINPLGKGNGKPTHGSHRIDIEFYNPDSTESRDFRDCYVGEIDFPWSDVYLAGDIMPLVSTRQDVADVFGKPVNLNSTVREWVYCENSQRKEPLSSIDEETKYIKLRFQAGKTEKVDDILMHVTLRWFDPDVENKTLEEAE